MPEERVQLVGISGSLRRGSNSTAILRTLKELAAAEADVNVVSVELPLYNGDTDGENTPEVVRSFQKAIGAAEGLLIVSPEYNYGTPGVLKNALDWASRPPESAVLKGKQVLVISSSAGIFGGVRAQAQLRQTLFSTMSHVMPWPDVAIPRAGDKITDGRLVDATSIKVCMNALNAFLKLLRAARQPA